jgi:hypothetical protein
MKMQRHALILFAMFALEVTAMAASPGLKVWVEDPLVKVLKTMQSPASAPAAVVIDSARNEYESAQIVVRSDGQAIEKLAVEVSKPSGTPTPTVTAQFVGYVPVKHGTIDTPDDHLVAKPPVDLPDPILDKETISLPADQSQPIWITVYVPRDTKPGDYAASIKITADTSVVTVPLKIKVHPFTLPDDRTLQLTNWFSPGNIAAWHHVPIWSDRFWRVLENYASCMASYRQNVLITPNWELIVCHDDGKGNLTFDFSQFDRWVELFIKAGVIGTIEGGHFGGRGEWTAADFDSYAPRILSPDGSEKPRKSLKVTSEEYRAFLAQYLPALQKHLEKNGWLKQYVQHLCDEPIKENAESYKKLASYVKQYAPKLRIIDACMCSELAGSIDIWVPQPPHFESDIKFFRERQKAGDEVWFYTCLSPKGRYMNRFVDYPLIDVRLLHWVNFKYDLPGYLHWGFNYARGDPFQNLEPDWGNNTFLPPGDSHIVYPGKAGPLSSIRLEALRDGVEDYEMLKLLEKKSPKLAREICDSIVRSLTDYTMDPAQFRTARAQLLSALDKTAK